MTPAVALFGQEKLIEGLEKGRGRTRAARGLLAISFALLGAGVGIVASLVL